MTPREQIEALHKRTHDAHLALIKASQQFAIYADAHDAKSPPDTAKAEVNNTLSIYCRVESARALSPLVGDIIDPEPDDLDPIMAAIAAEVRRAEANWPPMNSAHEAYAVLAEEMDELWDHVKTNQKRRDPEAMRAECLQVAAMAVRFIRDVLDGGRVRS